MAEYWVVDPELDAVKIYRRGPEGYSRVAELTAEAGDALTTPLLPEFCVHMKDVFAPPL